MTWSHFIYSFMPFAVPAGKSLQNMEFRPFHSHHLLSLSFPPASGCRYKRDLIAVSMPKTPPLRPEIRPPSPKNPSSPRSRLYIYRSFQSDLDCINLSDAASFFPVLNPQFAPLLFPPLTSP